MKYKLLLPVMALMISCNFITGLGSGSSSEFSVDLDSPADPVNVTVELNENETTSAVISPEGGELTLVSADGSVYTLDLPAGALLADTEISMTAIGSLEGGPVESNVYGVQLEPSGMAFYEFLTLTIQPAEEIPLEEQFMFKYEGSGENLHHAMVDPNTEEIRIKLLSFSGGGVGFATKGKIDLRKVRSDQLKFDNTLGELVQDARKATTPAGKDALVKEIKKHLESQDKLVDTLISAAKKDCDNVEAADKAKRKQTQYFKEYLSLLREIDGGDDFDTLNNKQREEIEELINKCMIARVNGEYVGSNVRGEFDYLRTKSFTLTVSGHCNGTMVFSGIQGGGVVCEMTCGGVNFLGNGTYKREEASGGGSGNLKGSCSSISPKTPGDVAEEDKFMLYYILMDR